MAKSARIAVSNSAAVLLDVSAGAIGGHLAIQNTDAAIIVYVGDSNVDSTSGYELRPGATLLLDVTAARNLYGRAASGAPVVAVLRT